MRCCPPMRRIRHWCGSLINPKEGEEMKSSDIACTAKFAHLAGIYPKRAQAEKEADAKKLKRAKVEDEEEDAEDAPDEKKDSRKAKRAKADEGKKEDAEARGRRLERARA